MRSEFFRVLRPLLPLGLAATAMGIASGIATALLLATANRALQSSQGAAAGLLISFAGLCAIVLLGEIASDIGTNLVGQRALAVLRETLAARILDLPLARLEGLRPHRLLAILNEDIETIGNLSFAFSSLAIAIAVSLSCLGYMLFLSPALFALTAIAIGLGTVGHAWARQRGLRRFAAAREAGDVLQRHYRAITEGAKELKLHRGRRATLSAEIAATVGGIRTARIRAINIFVTANAFGSLLYFAIIGLMLWLGSAGMGVGRPALSGFVLVLLYLKGPVEQIVNALPLLGRTQVALRRVAELSDEVLQPETATTTGFDQPGQAFGSLALRGVTHVFPAADGSAGFAIGPIDLELKRGETLFIVGANGSGKTTLIKTLLGLYPPGGGQIILNGQPVPADGLDAYRQLFSAVFTDYFLFDGLPNTAADGEELARRNLERFELNGKVAIRDGTFSTTDLSTGQRKRLALIQACLEERPVMMLDEWAADQDPAFRKIFYTEVLPELQAAGRTLIVVSHDDRYFGVADRVIRLRDGRIEAEWRNAGSQPAGAAP